MRLESFGDLESPFLSEGSASREFYYDSEPLLFPNIPPPAVNNFKWKVTQYTFLLTSFILFALSTAAGVIVLWKNYYTISLEELKTNIFSILEILVLSCSLLIYIHAGHIQTELLLRGLLRAKKQLDILKTMPMFTFGVVSTLTLFLPPLLVVKETRKIQIFVVVLALSHTFQAAVALCMFLLVLSGSILVVTPDVANKLKVSLPIDSNDTMEILSSQRNLIETQQEHIRDLTSELANLHGFKGYSLRLEKVFRDYKEAVGRCDEKEQEIICLLSQKFKLESDLNWASEANEELLAEITTLRRDLEQKKSRMNRLSETNLQFFDENQRLQLMMESANSQNLSLETAMDYHQKAIEHLVANLDGVGDPNLSDPSDKDA